MRRSLRWGLVAMALAAAPVLAQPQIESVELGLGGRFLPGVPTPVAVSIRPGGISRAVILEIFQRAERGSLERVQVPLHLGPRTRQQISIDFPIKSVSAPLEITLRDDTGELARMTKDVRQLWSESPLTLGIALDPQIPLRLIEIDLEKLPKRWTSYEGVGRIVWGRADPARLSAEQRRALQGWLVRGGELIILSGANWPEQSPSPPWWEKLLPITEGHVVRRAFDGQETFWLEGQPRPEAQVTHTAQGYPLAWEHPIGEGRVILVASNALPEELKLPTLSPKRSSEEDLLIAKALGSMTIPYPSRELISIALILFVMLVGLSGALVTRAPRTPLWIGVVALGLSAGFYSYQRSAEFSSDTYTLEIGVMRVSPVLSWESYWYGVFVQRPHDVSLTVSADVISALNPGTLLPSAEELVKELMPGGDWKVSFRSERASVRFVKVERMREPWIVGRLEGSQAWLSHRAPVALQDVIAYSGGAFYKLGTIAAQAELVRPLTERISQADWMSTLSGERRRVWQQWGRISSKTQFIGWIEHPRASPIGLAPRERRTALYLVIVERE